MKNYKIGLDIALRSNGLVILNEDNTIKHAELIQTVPSITKKQEKDPRYIVRNEEEIILTTSIEIYTAFRRINDASTNNISNVNIEGLALGAMSGHKDIMAGIHWYIRCMILHDFNIKCKVVTPMAWRKGYISNYDKLNYGLQYGIDDPIEKIIMYDKIPENDKAIIDKVNSEQGLNKWSHLDLSDAYWIARYSK